MAKYKVIHAFTDLEDQDKEYKVNDIFPNPVNKKISKERIKELSSSKNKQGKPLIKEVTEQE